MKKAKTTVAKSGGRQGAIPNLFETATAAPEIFKVKKKSKKERPVKEYDDRLDQLAAIVVLIKSLAGIGKQLGGELDAYGFGLLADEACKTKQHPVNFLAQSELVTADVQMRRNSSKSPVDDALVEELKEKGIPLGTDIKVPARFILDATLLQDPTIQTALSEAIMGHPRLKGIASLLIKKQEEESCKVVIDSTLPACAEKLSKEDYIRIVPMLSCMSIGKFQIDGAPVEEGSGEEKMVSEHAKAASIGILQHMGVLPPTINLKKKKG